jgi:hypothetical protein
MATIMDSSQPISGHKDCPDCGTPIWGDETSCWLCGWKRGQPVSAQPKQAGPSKENPYASPVSPNLRDLKWTFSLSTLFLWTALAAVVMGVVRIAPGLGIALGVLAIPAALHTTAIAAKRERRTGHALTVPEKIAAFGVSFAFATWIACGSFIAAFAAFFVTCTAGLTIGNGFGRSGDYVLLVSAFVACAVFLSFLAYFLIRSVRRSKG